MSKSTRLKKLKLLKTIAAQQRLADSLEQEKHINIVQTKIMEAELKNMKQQLEQLQQKRQMVISLTEQLEAEENDVSALVDESNDNKAD